MSTPEPALPAGRMMMAMADDVLTGPDEAVADRVAALLPSSGRLRVASSGGADSSVLLALAVRALSLTHAVLGLIYSMVNVPYGSLATAMAQVSRERAKLAVAPGLGAGVGGLPLAFIIAAQVQSIPA